MTLAGIAAHQPLILDTAAAPLALARARMERTGQWQPGQQMGLRWAIGCVALEITQRCNLDCTLCYLSESSEALKDIPLEEVFGRIDLIAAHYGPHTDVQVTGGDPTLRRRDELVAIVRRVRAKGMRPALFTNGILATRELLAQLADAGLVDVAFHVDLTQERKGYASERELNAIRREYIERARPDAAVSPRLTRSGQCLRWCFAALLTPLTLVEDSALLSAACALYRAVRDT